MRTPLKFEDLTLNQFMQLHGLVKSDDIDYKISKLSILSGESKEHIEDLDISEFNKLCASTAFTELPPIELAVKDKLKLKELILEPTLSLTDMKVNQLVDYHSLIKASGGNYINCANTLLAIMYKPVGEKYNPDNHAKISELLLSAKVGDCLGLLFFYSRFWKKCEPIITDYLAKAKQTIAETMKMIMEDREFVDFWNNGGGNITSTNVEKTQA